MSDFFKSMECEKCGSNEIDFVSEGVYECAHCGTKIIARSENNEGEIEQEFLALSERYSIEEFKRNAYIEIYSEIEAPADIDDSDFGEPYVEYSHYGIVTADHTLNYSVDIGHDRTEQYVEYETKYRDGKSYKVEVVKERTVTDWTPMSGTYSGKEWGIVKLDSHNKQDISDAYATIEEIEFENYFDSAWRAGAVKEYEDCDYEEEPMSLFDADIEEAMQRGAESLSSACQVGLPGDSNRNFNYSAKSTPVKIESVACKEYVLPFKYEGKPYEAKGYCSSNTVRTTFCPEVDAYGEQRAKNEKKDDKNLKLGCLTTIIISAIGIILGLILQNIAVSIFVPLIAFAIMGAIFGISGKIIGNKRKNDEIALKEYCQNRKKQALINRLSKLGLRAPTEKELEKFDNWRR